MFKQGDKVRVKRSVTRPYYGFGPKVTHESVGQVKHDVLLGSQEVSVNFPGHSHWNGKVSELELIAEPITAQATAVSALTSRVVSTSQGVQAGHTIGVLTSTLVAEKQKRKSPDKVLAYGIILKDGSLHGIKFDRDDARREKARLGGKQRGITIVVLNAGKEIR